MSAAAAPGADNRGQPSASNPLIHYQKGQALEARRGAANLTVSARRLEEGWTLSQTAAGRLAAAERQEDLT